MEKLFIKQISCVHLKKRKKLMEHPNIWKNYFIYRVFWKKGIVRLPEEEEDRVEQSIYNMINQS